MTKKHFSHHDIMSFEKKFRVQFINSIGGFKSVCMIGTKNDEGLTNLGIFSSIVHIGANPPLIGFVIRPDSTIRHTLENISQTSFYTINHLNKSIYSNAHQTSARYPKDVSEFKATKLTEEYLNGFPVPFVKESSVQIGLEFKEKVDFTINGTIFIIGEVKECYFPEESLQEDGFLDLDLAGTITCSGLDSYHTTSKIGRLSYAKPDITPHLI